MPLLQITTNATNQKFDTTTFQRDLASRAAELVGKKLDYVMTTLEFFEHMTFAGTDAPAAYVEFKNIGTLDAELTKALSEVICDALHETLEVSPERVYIEFQEQARHHWGWNRQNFA